MPPFKTITLGFGFPFLLSAGLVGCAAPAPSGAAIAQQAAPNAADATIDSALRTDPRFTDFVHMIDFAGMARELKGAQNITIFAPTNAAFDKSDPHWRVTAVPAEVSGVPTKFETRQDLLSDSAIRGIHPAAEFIGKLQDVSSVGGAVFHVDGRKPGEITISSGQTGSTMLGSPKIVLATADLQLPPLQTTQGLIYAVNGIIVPLAGR